MEHLAAEQELPAVLLARMAVPVLLVLAALAAITPELQAAFLELLEQGELLVIAAQVVHHRIQVLVLLEALELTEQAD